MFNDVKAPAGSAFQSNDMLAGVTAPGGNSGSGTPDENLVLDLDSVSGAAFEAIPPGVYNAKVENTEYTLSSNNNPMITVSFRISDPEGTYDKRLVFNHYTLTADFGKAMLKQFLGRITPEYPTSQFSPEKFCNEMVATGRACRVKLGVKMYQGQKRNQVKEVMEAGGADKFFG